MREQPSNMQRDILALHMEEQVEGIAAQRYGKTIRTCTDQELYYVLLTYCKRLLAVTERNAGEKRVYYLSSEFMTGRLLENNLINLKVYDRMKALLERNGKNLRSIEEYEPEPGLGCSGPGRLASCILDSIATLDLPGAGIGLNYHFGVFRQTFEDHQQKELPDAWIEKPSWERRTDISYYTWLGGHKVYSRMYDIDVIGWDAGVNKLHLFDIESVVRSENSLLSLPHLDQFAGRDPVQAGSARRSGRAIAGEDPLKSLSLKPYSYDTTPESKLQRLCQQYFMVSNAARFILHEMHERKYDLRHLCDHAVIQINDTYPTLVIPELILILTEEKALPLGEAIDVVSRTCAFTTHTIFQQDQEVVQMHDLEVAVPQLIPIIRELDARVRRRFDDPELWIIDGKNQVRLAAIDMHYCFSINRSAPLEGDVLNRTGLYKFHDLYPEKFNIKVNGITFRRWLLDCNHPLADFLSEKISDAYKRDPNRLEDLLALQNDPDILDGLGEIKRGNKRIFAEYLRAKEGVLLDPDGIFDMQVNRLHAYRRQHMNALYIIHRYLEIRAGRRPSRALNCIFGAKADPTNRETLDILHLLLVLQDLINSDPEVSPYLRVVYIPDYNVTWSQIAIPACDIAEQIALALREGISTSGMKLMVNGAVTLGTMDGANGIICSLVGEDNIYTFGMDVDTVYCLNGSEDYVPRSIYESSTAVREAVDFITGPECLAIGRKEILTRLRDGLLNEDRYMALGDLEDYIRTKDRMIEDYEDRISWNRMSLINIAKSGYFSADRMVEEYNRDIWHLR